MGYKETINYIKALNAAIETVGKEGYKLIFLALHGSQNYGLATENSDYDWYAAVEPTFHNFVFDEPLASKDIEYEYGIITVKDVRGMFQMIKKASFNFLEILFTDYYFVNEKYLEEWNSLRMLGSRISRSNPYATIRSYIGVAGNTLQDEMTGKKCAQILTFANQITSYIDGDDFNDVLMSEKIFNREFIMKIKTEEYTTGYLNILSQAQFNYLHNYGTNYLRDKNAAKMMDINTRDAIDSILIDICRKKSW